MRATERILVALSLLVGVVCTSVDAHGSEEGQESPAQNAEEPSNDPETRESSKIPPSGANAKKLPSVKKLPTCPQSEKGPTDDSSGRTSVEKDCVKRPATPTKGKSLPGVKRPTDEVKSSSDEELLRDLELLLMLDLLENLDIFTETPES